MNGEGGMLLKSFFSPFLQMEGWKSNPMMAEIFKICISGFKPGVMLEYL